MKFNNNIFQACIRTSEENRLLQHFHNAYELIFVEHGSARFKIGTSEYYAKENALLLIGKLEGHEMHICERPYNRVYIQITPQQLDSAISEAQLKSLFISRPPGFCHMFDLTPYREQVIKIIDSLMEENSQPHAKTAAYSLLTLLIVLCFRCGGDQNKKNYETPNKIIMEIQKYLDKNFTQDIILKNLAEQHFISESHLSHSFRKWTGKSPKQYIMNSRIALAKELLLFDHYSIAVIAFKCGFSDVSNFIRYFKNETNMTPLKYRQKFHG